MNGLKRTEKLDDYVSSSFISLIRILCIDESGVVKNDMRLYKQWCHLLDQTLIFSVCAEF